MFQAGLDELAAELPAAGLLALRAGFLDGSLAPAKGAGAGQPKYLMSAHAYDADGREATLATPARTGPQRGIRGVAIGAAGEGSGSWLGASRSDG
jgi:hypothetical protein